MSKRKTEHPSIHAVNVVLTNGETFVVQTSYGKEGDTLKLDVDPYNHQAWKDNQSVFINTANSRVTNFNNRFGNIFTVKSKE
ncbi:MAG: 50S ribosomal protein L31 [Rickettsiales bacterium]|jgi:large subunit ribosomal protein L31|nr:50S ribosomal protein L31 [Rickettsiales bacterium]